MGIGSIVSGAIGALGVPGVSEAIGVGGSLLGGSQQASAASDAAAAQEAMYQQTREDLSPYRDAGAQGLDAYLSELGVSADGYNAPAGPVFPDAPDVSYNALAEGFQQSPGYDYALEQGQQAIQNSASARGNLHSGNTQLELLRHAMGQADQGFNNYLNVNRQGLTDNYNMQRQGVTDNYNVRQQSLSRLEGLANSGAQAATQTGQFGANSATNAGNFNLQGAAAQAGGIAGAVNSIGGYAQNQQNTGLLNSAMTGTPYNPPTIGSIFGGA